MTHVLHGSSQLEEYLERQCSSDAKPQTYPQETASARDCYRSGPYLRQTADMDPILALARQYSLLLLRMLDQAHVLSTSLIHKHWKKRKYGPCGGIQLLSGKESRACGEAGA